MLAVMAQPRIKNDIFMTLRYPKALRDKLKVIAEKERRSINEQIVYALERWFEQQKTR